MKKVSISGKGGVGKSMVTSLLANVLVERGRSVLVVDCDESNPGLYRMLGFSAAPQPLIELFGGERRIMEAAKPETARPAEGWLARPEFRLADVPQRYIVAKDGLRLMTAGKITTAFEGCACPMAEVVKLLLARLALGDGEIALVDMEAGVEHFGRGVEKGIDTVLVVVEPSYESIALAAKVNFLARSSGARDIRAILNKVPTPEIAARLRQELSKRGVAVAGIVSYDPEVAAACLDGRPLGESPAKADVRAILDTLLGGPPAEAIIAPPLKQ